MDMYALQGTVNLKSYRPGQQFELNSIEFQELRFQIVIILYLLTLALKCYLSQR